MPFRISGITARWPAAATRRTAVGTTPSSIASLMAPSISARCINSPMAPAAATRPPQPGRPQPVRRKQKRITAAYGFDFGGEYHKFSADVVYQHYNQAISVLNPLLGAQSPTQSYQSTTNSINTNPIDGGNLIGTTNTVYGIVTDNSAIMVAAKYTWDPFKIFAGYEHIRQTNPSNPLGVGASDQGGYIMSGVEDDNLDSPKIVQIWWTGVKYAIDSKTGITFAWYHQLQNDFRIPSTCSPEAGFRSSCASTPSTSFREKVALHGSSLHQALRRFCRSCVFLRGRRSGHRHSTWPRCSL